MPTNTSSLASRTRVKAVVAYDGSSYRGFQKQPHTKHTITTAIETALCSLQIHSDITGSGRTDAGVHATGQVLHFDLPTYWTDLKRLKRSINQVLVDIKIKHISYVDDDFHARFSAKKRIYRYVFRKENVSLFEQKYVSQYDDFSASKLEVSLKTFEGEHDFDFFRKTGTQTHTSIRRVLKAHYVQRGKYHYIYFCANGFLRSQVRMMIDTAMMYARSELTLEQLKEQLDCKHKHISNLAPPQGLYLARILYT